MTYSTDFNSFEYSLIAQGRYFDRCYDPQTTLYDLKINPQQKRLMHNPVRIGKQNIQFVMSEKVCR